MRVTIDATAIGSGQGGDDSMARGLLSGLASAVRTGDEFPLIVRAGALLPPAVAGHPQFPVTTMRRLPGPMHFTVGLPRVLASMARSAPVPDLVCAINHGPVRSPAPVALFVQDLSFHHHPEHYPPATRWRLRTVVPYQARRAQAVLTISEFSRADLVASYGLDPEHVLVVADAVDAPPPFGPGDAAAGRAWLAGAGVPGRFVLCLGNLHPRKNVERLVRAFGRLRAEHADLADVQLVVAGARWWGEGEEAAAAAHAPAGAVVFLGHVSEPQKEQLLHLADALAYVSLFEGFGLPPLEAMARGTAVVASGTTAVAETTGDAALHVDPLDVGAITDAIAAVLHDDALRSSLIARGHERAATYDVERTGREARAAFAHAITARFGQRPRPTPAISAAPAPQTSLLGSTGAPEPESGQHPRPTPAISAAPAPRTSLLGSTGAPEPESGQRPRPSVAVAADAPHGRRLDPPAPSGRTRAAPETDG